LSFVLVKRIGGRSQHGGRVALIGNRRKREIVDQDPPAMGMGISDQGIEAPLTLPSPPDAQPYQRDDDKTSNDAPSLQRAEPRRVGGVRFRRGGVAHRHAFALELYSRTG